MKMPKILFLGDVLNARYGLAARGLLYKEYLEENGFEVDVVSCTNYEKLKDIPEDFHIPYMTENQILELAGESDIIVCIKVIHPQLIRQIYENTTAKIVFDMYDSLKKQNQQKYDEIFSLIDVFIAEGEYLKDKLSEYGKPVFGLKSACVYENFDGRQSKQDQTVTVGWIGSISTYRALSNVQNAINRLADKYSNMQLRIVGADKNTKLVNFSENVKVTYIPKYDHTIMLKELEQFDIGIYPPPGDDLDYVIRGPHKGLRYMGAKIAAVFYGVGDCLEFVNHAQNAMLYHSEEEFEAALELLIQNAELRKHIAEKGYEYVCNQYSFEAVADELRSILIAVDQLYLRRFHFGQRR